MEAENAQESYAAKLADLHRIQQGFESWLASLSEFRPGDEVPVPHMKKTGRLVRIQFNKQIAVVDVDNLQVEVPLRELLPDLGQAGVRQEIASLREQILAQARQAESLRAEAERLQIEYHRSLAQARDRREQFDRWLAAVGAARVGQRVTIAAPPGAGKLLELNMLAGLAKVQTDKGTLELPIQELFPQVGPFARRAAKGPQRAAKARPEKAEDQPVRHRRPDSRSAKADRDAVLKVQPGQQLYVLPFHKRATLIRFNHDKDQAVVQAGAFEMQIPIADLAPVRETK